jgi:hypothetical protein
MANLMKDGGDESVRGCPEQLLKCGRGQTYSVTILRNQTKA